MHFNALQVSLLKEMINDSKNSELCLMFQGMWHIILYGAFIALWFIQFCTTNDKKIKKKKSLFSLCGLEVEVAVSSFHNCNDVF